MEGPIEKDDPPSDDDDVEQPSEDSLSLETVPLGGESAKKKFRGPGKPRVNSVHPTGVGMDTLKIWLKKHAKYGPEDKNIPSTLLGQDTGLRLDKVSKRPYCHHCSVPPGLCYVTFDSKTHLGQHFGLKKSMPTASHLKSISQPKMEEVLSRAGIEEAGQTQEAFEEELVTLAASLRLSGLQLEGLFPFLRKYTLNGLAQGLPQTGYALLTKRLQHAYETMEQELQEKRKGHQQHLANDGAQDNRGRSVFLTTSEFAGGKSQLISIDFPEKSMNAGALNDLFMKTLVKVGGMEKVDSVHLV